MKGTKHQSAESKYPSIISNGQREHSLKKTEFKSRNQLSKCRIKQAKYRSAESKKG
jgi:hypothetical protein